MNEVFGSVYANSYDLFYRDKDYAAECALIEDIFQEYGKGPIRSVLDLGCGTGNHAIPLARHGYEVTGVERSESMLAHARRKAEDALADRQLHFQQGDIRDLDLGKQFDAALMMFAVLGYQVENADVLGALKTARRHLRPGGLLVFDVWYGPAVLRERPSQRIKVIPTTDGKILRAASGTVDSARHLCTVDYLVWQIAGSKAVAEAQESHTMRYFFPRELDLLLECTNLTFLRLGSFPDFQRDPDDSTWNVMAVARAVQNS